MIQKRWLIAGQGEGGDGKNQTGADDAGGIPIESNTVPVTIRVPSNCANTVTSFLERHSTYGRWIRGQVGSAKDTDTPTVSTTEHDYRLEKVLDRKTGKKMARLVFVSARAVKCCVVDVDSGNNSNEISNDHAVESSSSGAEEHSKGSGDDRGSAARSLLDDIDCCCVQVEIAASLAKQANLDRNANAGARAEASRREAQRRAAKERRAKATQEAAQAQESIVSERGQEVQTPGALAPATNAFGLSWGGV